MKIGSSVTSSPDFQQNKDFSLRLLAELRDHQQSLFPEPTDPLLRRHTDRGKLFVRDRIDLLLDPGSPFLEIAPFAGMNLYEGVRPGAGLVAGIGLVHGRECMIIANDATVKGGTYFPMTVKKHLRAQEIALENRLPCIYLVDSGGAFLPLQSEVFPDRDHFGRIFYNQARMSGFGIPQLAAVMGSCTAGGAYVPAMSDEAVIVRGQGTIFLGGPPLVRAATGEEITAEALGGGEVHSRISGVTDHLAEDDQDALEILRSIVAHLGPRTGARCDVVEARPPAYDPEEIYGLLPHDPKKPFPMREILARIIDESELQEFKREYGKTLICGFARIEGHLIGLLANDGILFSESALKGVHFLQLCNQRRIPVVFFQNIVGFMVGRQYEHGGIAKDGAKLVTAVACSSVPKFTIVMGGSFGAGNYAMAGRAYQPRTLFTWPNSRTAVMGPEQAAAVLTLVRKESYAAQGKPWSAEDEEAYRQEIETTYRNESNAYFGTARLWDDGVIDPLDTRRVLALSVSASYNAETSAPRYGVFRT